MRKAQKMFAMFLFIYFVINSFKYDHVSNLNAMLDKL